MLKETF